MFDLKKLKPYKWFYIMRFKNALKFMRSIGANLITDRIKQLNSDLGVPGDLLTLIIDLNGFFFSLFNSFCFYFNYSLFAINHLITIKLRRRYKKYRKND